MANSSQFQSSAMLIILEVKCETINTQSHYSINTHLTVTFNPSFSFAFFPLFQFPSSSNFKRHQSLQSTDTMPLYTANLATKLPHRFGFTRTNTSSLPNYAGFKPFFVFFPSTHVHNSSRNRTCSSAPSSSSIMEDNKHVGPLISGSKSLSQELRVAVGAVQMACFLCQRVQSNLLTSNAQIQAKDDNSPVTVADWSVQAIISWILSKSFGSKNVSIVAEEDVQTLSKPGADRLLKAVVETVNECLCEAYRFGLEGPESTLCTAEVLEAISRCNSSGGPTGRFWTLDPVDGTLGFIRGDQYAVALALIEDGEVVLGVLGCPNYPMRKEWLCYHPRYHSIISKLSTTTSGSWDKGCVIYAQKGSGEAWMQPLIHVNKKLVWPNSAIPIQVSSIDDPALATFCEPVEKANSSHSFTAGLAHSVGLRNQPLRVYSMVKYAAIARGDAEIFMKFARAGYKEKIWDHAAGVVIIQEAGGVVTDAGGCPLNFSKGMYLEGLDRGVIACAGANLHDKIISAVDASWNSSCL